MPKRYTDKLTEESRTKKNNTYKKYIDEFMPSDEMRNYLKTQELTPYQIASLIFNSPYSIDQKKNAFYSLLSETDDSELKALCSNCIENIEKAYELLSTGDNQDCCSLWHLYWAGPRTWKTGAVKHGRVGYVLRNDFIVPPLYNAKRYDGVLPSTFKIFHEIKQAFGDDEQKYYELDSFVSAGGITEDEIQNFINSEVDNGKL